MEENKDFFAETENTQTSAETNNDAAETPDEVKGTINVIAGEDGPTAVFTADSTPAKKKTIQTPIIIAGVIVLAFIAAFFVFTSFFNSSIVGTWVLVEDSNGATYDEAGDGITYYTLDKDGNITVSVGTITQKSTYTTTSENGTDYVNSTNVFSGSYTISGNIFTGRTFKLTVDGVEKPYIFMANPRWRSTSTPFCCRRAARCMWRAWIPQTKTNSTISARPWAWCSRARTTRSLPPWWRKMSPLRWKIWACRRRRCAAVGMKR